jgi:hypothetical protein
MADTLCGYGGNDITYTVYYISIIIVLYHHVRTVGFKRAITFPSCLLPDLPKVEMLLEEVYRPAHKPMVLLCQILCFPVFIYLEI